MTAAEIRAHSSKTFADLRNGVIHGDLAGVSLSVEVHKFQMLAEIAAQVAELNEHTRQVDSEVFGAGRKNEIQKGDTDGKC